jgi:hypothetical protein
VLQVVRRFIGWNPTGAAALVAFNILETTLEVGDYRKDIRTAQRGVGGVWKECAKQIVKQLRAWMSGKNSEAPSTHDGAQIGPG